MSYPQSIQNIFEILNDGVDLSDLYNQFTKREQELTETLCYSDSLDFIVMEGLDAFQFIYNDQNDTWNVQHVGRPIYEVEPEMVGDGTVKFDEFLAELQHELPGVEVRRGSALSNLRSKFVQNFKPQLEKAVQSALESL